MNGYQPSLVPQPAVTFGEERLVDPWATTMLQNTCNNFQVQNMALQQENAALKSKNQSLQQQKINPLSKAADRAYMRELTAYGTEHLVKFPDGRYQVVKENNLGEPYKVVKPLSDCTEFSARYVFDPRDSSTLIEVQYRLPNGKLSGFSIPAEKFQKGTLAQNFYKSGGTLHFGKDGPRLFYMLIAQLLSNRESCILSISGWNFTNSRWTFKDSAACKSILNSPILPAAGLASENQRMMSLVVGLSLLKTRFSEAMQPSKLFSLISEQNLVSTAESMGCKPTEFEKKLTANRDYLLVYIRDGSADCQLTGTGTNRIDENYRLLQEEIQKGTLSRTLYVILSTKITPALREKSLPIQVEESVTSVQDEVFPVTWNDMISMVENNPTEFNARIQRAYDEEYASLEDSTVRQDAAVLNAVVEIICWTVSRTVPKWAEQVRNAYTSSLEYHIRWWESLSDASAPEVFRDALYAAAQNGFLYFLEIKDADETFSKEKEVLYDDTYFYFSTAMLKKLIARFMPQYLASDVLAKLAEAGNLSGSVVRTLTLSPNRAHNFRFRIIPRSFVKKLGCRDIVSIKGDKANVVRTIRRNV